MNKLKQLINYFSTAEIILWCSSITLIIGSFAVFGGQNILNLCASLIGITALIFCAKGNPLGQLLIVIFSLFYGFISYTFAYYGEMITYLGMSAPMSLYALIAWLRNPYNGNRSEVKVNRLSARETYIMLLVSIPVTVAFYFILSAFDTANLIPSTLSVTTSFIAVYMSGRRSPYYALAYAANDIVLIVLWILAAISDISYLSVVICFVAFLANDIYSFINWKRMEKKQQA